MPSEVLMSMTPSRRALEAVRLKHLVEDSRALVYCCRACKRESIFLAADVVDIWGPEIQVYTPPHRCGHCRVTGRMTVRFISVSDYDRGKLMLRRPAGTRLVQLWKNEFY